MVTSPQSWVLPGGEDMPEGTTDVGLADDHLAPAIGWSAVTPGRKLLVETMRAAVGLPAIPSDIKTDGTMYITIEDFGLGNESPSTTEILLPAFRYLSSNLRPQSPHTPRHGYYIVTPR